MRIVRLYRSLPYRTDTQVLGKQLISCGTAVAENYRAESGQVEEAEWVAKIGILVEEEDETVFSIEMLSECEIVPLSKIKSLLAEAQELTAIFTASRRTARSNG